jgi:DNA-binding NarL/FixJ family response regulator
LRRASIAFAPAAGHSVARARRTSTLAARRAGIAAASRRVFALETLTARERQVLGQMAEGRSNSAIADALAVSSASVEKYVTSIFAKLGLPPSEPTTGGCSQYCATSIRDAPNRLSRRAEDG